MICKQCGKDFGDKEVRFCPACGTAQEQITKNRKKSIPPKYFALAAAAIFCIIVLLSKILCFHDWLPATCTTAATCTKCGKIKNEELSPHNWLDATCAEPSRCSECGEIKNMELLLHNWLDATCTEPSKCSQCGESRGAAKNHNVNDKGKCIACGKAIGQELTAANYGEYLNFRVSYSDIVSTVRRRIAYNENGVIFHPTEIRMEDVYISASAKKDVKFTDVVVYGNIVTSNTDFITPYAVNEDNTTELTFKITIDSSGTTSKIEADGNTFESDSIYFLLSPNPSNYFDNQISPYFNVTRISGKVAAN